MTDRVVVEEEEKISVPKSILNRICGMVYVSRGELHQGHRITNTEYAYLVELMHSSHDPIDSVLTALSVMSDAEECDYDD